MYVVTAKWRYHALTWVVGVFFEKKKALLCLDDLHCDFGNDLETWFSEPPIGAEVRRVLEAVLRDGDGGEWKAFDLMEEVEARRDEDEYGETTPYSEYERKVAGDLYDMLCQQADERRCL